MKAITLRPPWGWAVLNGKSPENRSRNIAGSVAALVLAARITRMDREARRG